MFEAVCRGNAYQTC